MEAYRSGHNEAVLKTVWVQAHGGSNPSASAKANGTLGVPFALVKAEVKYCFILTIYIMVFYIF